MSDFLLEVGTEEIPARLVPGATAELRRRFLHAVRSMGVAGGASVSAVATPRRLVLFAQGLPARQLDRQQKVTGPALRVAFDARGNPTPAGLGFARKVGVDVSDLQVGTDGKLFLDRTIVGRSVKDLLAEALPGVVLGVRFPRSMYWSGKGGPRFIRPIRWLVALLDGEVVPFEVAGVHSGDATWGHRRLGSGPLRVSGAEDFRRALRDNGVLLSGGERATRILAEARSLLPEGMQLRENERLVQTLVNETEHPTAVLGRFEARYLELPEEVLETVMLVHQKYFAVERGDGSMANLFIAVANAAADQSGVIRRGHERVLRARFNDAQFFWEFDQRSTLADRIEDLDEVTFQASLGSYKAKTEDNLAAVEGLVETLGVAGSPANAARRAALLAKTDLTTEMVGEFPELQGKVGGLYATAQGESREVADAIYDHYLPIGAAGPIPRSLAGCIVSLADKLASLGGMFRVGLVPTGSKDPLALRRAAYGAARIVMETKAEISLDRLVELAAAGKNSGRLRGFLLDRFRHWLRESGGLEPDVIQAVLAADDQIPIDVAERAAALASVRHTDDFEGLAVSFKRIRNILGHAGFAAGRGLGRVNSSLLEPGAETELHEALSPLSSTIAELTSIRDYTASLRAIAALRPSVDRYFDAVLVMADDETVRNNRLAFLASMLRTLSTIADFAEMAPDSGS